MTRHTDPAVAREIRESYRHLRRAEIKEASLRRDTRRGLRDRIRWARWYRMHYRPAAARFDQAVLALEAHLAEHHPAPSGRDLLDECKAILYPDDEET
ncbi:MAG: hypothetical protein ACRCYQ_13195 [Nocardioides sp.]